MASSDRSVWFLWLQGWIYENNVSVKSLFKLPNTLTLRIPLINELSSGLGGTLKEIAAWKTKIQFVQGLQDAFHNAIAVEADDTCVKLLEALECVKLRFKEFPTDVVIAEVLKLGAHIWGTHEGNRLVSILYRMCHLFGDGLTASQVRTLVVRERGYSRIGINALGILYDTFPEHCKALKLVECFCDDDPHIAWYCAFREISLRNTVWKILRSGGNVTFKNLRFDESVRDDLLNEWGNRGDSALLDNLCLADISRPAGDGPQ